MYASIVMVALLEVSCRSRAVSIPLTHLRLWRTMLASHRKCQNWKRIDLLDNDLIARYNYDSFVPEKFGP